MSKLSFRARALDAAKAMPVFVAQDIPELQDFTAINRAVPQMPTGMEKEEETVRFICGFPKVADFPGGHIGILLVDWV